MSEFFDHLLFQPEYDPLTLILDMVFTAVVLTSFITVVTYKGSILVKLMDIYDPEQAKSMDIKDIIGRMSTISTTLAGISLATIALLSNLLIQNPHQLLLIVGGGLVLSSSVLFFWGMALCFNATGTAKNHRSTAINAFQRGDAFTSFGVFLFFTGLLWVLSNIDVWLTIIAFITYVTVLIFMIARPVKVGEPSDDTSK